MSGLQEIHQDFQEIHQDWQEIHQGLQESQDSQDSEFRFVIFRISRAGRGGLSPVKITPDHNQRGPCVHGIIIKPLGLHVLAAASFNELPFLVEQPARQKQEVLSGVEEEILVLNFRV